MTRLRIRHCQHILEMLLGWETHRHWKQQQSELLHLINLRYQVVFIHQTTTAMFSAYTQIMKLLWVPLYEVGYSIVVTQAKEKALSNQAKITEFRWFLECLRESSWGLKRNKMLFFCIVFLNLSSFLQYFCVVYFKWSSTILIKLEWDG